MMEVMMMMRRKRRKWVSNDTNDIIAPGEEEGKEQAARDKLQISEDL